MDQVMGDERIKPEGEFARENSINVLRAADNYLMSRLEKKGDGTGCGGGDPTGDYKSASVLRLAGDGLSSGKTAFEESVEWLM